MKISFTMDFFGLIVWFYVNVQQITSLLRLRVYGMNFVQRFSSADVYSLCLSRHLIHT